MRGYRRYLGLVSWRFSLGKMGRTSQVKGWKKPAGRGLVAGSLPKRQPVKTFSSLTFVASSLYSEWKKEHCFMMGWSFCVTHSFRSFWGISRVKVREAGDALLVRWWIAPEKDCWWNLATSQNLWEKQIQPSEKERTENCGGFKGAVSLLACNAELLE